MSEAKAKSADLVEVTLKKPHTHGGEDYKAGAKIKVRPDQLERLKANGKV